MKNIKLFAIIFLATSIVTFAQSKETQEKLKNLEGEVIKITIETTGGKVELTGDDAKAMMSKMKGKGKSSYVFIDDGGKTKEIKVDVDVEDKGGEKVVIIKKNIDGKETVKKYKGEAAEYYIQEMKSKNGMKFISKDGDVNIIVKEDNDLVWISEDDEECIKKKVNVEVVDGVKKVTVTTTEDGKEKVEVYEGEEAEKFLEKMEHKKKKVYKKKIIIEEEHDDD
ncbi:MAG: hypothetical protein ABFS12_04985 [Bacteroidota bacterium]